MTASTGGGTAPGEATEVNVVDSQAANLEAAEEESSETTPDPPLGARVLQVSAQERKAKLAELLADVAQSVVAGEGRGALRSVAVP